VIFDEVRAEWEQEWGRPLPIEWVQAEAYWLWHDHARALVHVMHAERGYDVLTQGPVSGESALSGAAAIEGFVAAETNGNPTALRGAQAGITRALSEIASTLTSAFASLPRPTRPVWSGPIPLPQEDDHQ
jgi:hypothetical protein